MEWIRGHTVIQNSEEADAATRQGHFNAVWELNPSQNNDFQCHALFSGAAAEDDALYILKNQPVSQTNHTRVT